MYVPPSISKTTVIATMTKLMDYNVYDLELTTIKDTATLRKLLIEAPSKSINVIEALSLMHSRENCMESKDGNRLIL